MPQRFPNRISNEHYAAERSAKSPQRSNYSTEHQGATVVGLQTGIELIPELGRISPDPDPGSQNPEADRTKRKVNQCACAKKEIEVHLLSSTLAQ